MKSVLLLVSVIVVVSPGNAAAEWPDRPIRYIVPSNAGNGADISARMLTSGLVEQFKQQFVIDNRPGSGGLIGLQLLARARPDGYTLGYGNTAYLTINPPLMPNIPYDVDRDFELVGQFTSGQNLLATRFALPVKSVRELIAYARANPDKLSFASSGTGTSIHLSGELFKQLTGVRMVHVPYKAMQQGIAEMMGNQIDLVFDNQPSIGPFVLSGKVRALATTGSTRSIAFPELPTMIEAGVPGYDISTWTAMIAPKGVPHAIVVRLNAGIEKACKALEAKLNISGQSCATKSVEQFVQFVKAEQKKYGDIVRKSGAKVD